MSELNPYELNQLKREAEAKPKLNDLDRNFLGGILESIELLTQQLQEYAHEYQAEQEFVEKATELRVACEECSSVLFK